MYREIFFLFKIIHRPIQIEGKSRVDTWQKFIRQEQNIKEVCDIF
jgi:hypothetical protein